MLIQFCFLLLLVRVSWTNVHNLLLRKVYFCTEKAKNVVKVNVVIVYISIKNN